MKSKVKVKQHLARARKNAWTPAARAKRAATLEAKRNAAVAAVTEKRRVLNAIVAHGLRQKLADHRIEAAPSNEDASNKARQVMESLTKGEWTRPPSKCTLKISIDETRSLEGTIDEMRSVFLELRSFFARDRSIL